RADDRHVPSHFPARSGNLTALTQANESRMTFLELLQSDRTTVIIATIVLGLLVGSFLNVVIYRLPVMMRRAWREQCIDFLELNASDFQQAEPTHWHPVFILVKPDSHCLQCNAPVRPWQNIPVLS